MKMEQGEQDGRSAFEAWAIRVGSLEPVWKLTALQAWEAWQARAALTTPAGPAAVPPERFRDQIDAERVASDWIDSIVPTDRYRAFWQIERLSFAPHDGRVILARNKEKPVAVAVIVRDGMNWSNLIRWTAGAAAVPVIDEWFHEDSLTLVGWKYHCKGDGIGTYRLVTPSDTYNPDSVTFGSMVPVYERAALAPPQPASEQMPSEEARDAARYRWLRDVAQSQDWEWLGHSTTPATTDSAIDELMRATHPVRSAGE